MNEGFKSERGAQQEAAQKHDAREVYRDDMTDADIDDLRFLRNHLSQSRQDWSEASNEKVLDDFFWQHAHSYVIRGDLGETQELQHRIVATGQLDVQAQDGSGTVEHIVAHPDFRGKGLGRAVMEKIIHDARECGLHTLMLTSNPSRKAAHGLYKSLGFEIVGEKQKYDEEGNPTHTTCIFELVLNAE